MVLRFILFSLGAKMHINPIKWGFFMNNGKRYVITVRDDEGGRRGRVVVYNKKKNNILYPTL
jgi:hypothetical protein